MVERPHPSQILFSISSGPRFPGSGVSAMTSFSHSDLYLLQGILFPPHSILILILKLSYRTLVWGMRRYDFSMCSFVEPAPHSG